MNNDNSLAAGNPEVNVKTSPLDKLLYVLIAAFVIGIGYDIILENKNK